MIPKTLPITIYILKLPSYFLMFNNENVGSQNTITSENFGQKVENQQAKMLSKLGIEPETVSFLEGCSAN